MSATTSVAVSRREIKLTEKDIERFRSKVDRNGPVVREELGPCWVWTAGRFSVTNYGQFHIEGYPVLAHRAAFFIANQRTAEPQCLHHCDNKQCVNPSHLREGTHLDNMSDKVHRGRQAKGDSHGSKTKPGSLPRGADHFLSKHPERIRRGEAVGRGKLTAEKVLEIRARFAAGGITKETLSKEFGVSDTHIGFVISRKLWQHI